MRAILQEPNKDPKTIEIDNTLKALQKAVGGYIEAIPVTEDICLICNEEGVILGLEPQTILGRTILGNVLFVGVDGEEFTDIPDAWENVYGKEKKDDQAM